MEPRKINNCNVDYGRHELRGQGMPVDTGHVGPLLGNDQLKLLLDARGCMHDYTPPGSWPAPRVVWAGRRHNQRIDRYNSNLFEYGFFDLRLADEELLPPVIRWSQRLDPYDGYVETLLERAGGCCERVVTFLHLKRNLIVCRRSYAGLPVAVRSLARASYTFCQVGTAEIPFRTTWQPQPADSTGISARFTADGHRLYRGELALFSERPCMASASGNRLDFEIPLDDSGSATLCLALEDDLGDDPQLVGITEGDWMPKGVRAVQRENDAKAGVRQLPDPVALVAATRAQVATLGFDGLLAEQKAAWNEYNGLFRMTWPDSEPLLAAAFRGAIYQLRCSYSAYSLPANPFNSSWGGVYFVADERFPLEGLLAFGVPEMPRRIMDWRRSCLPFLSSRAGARGANYPHSSVEPGTTTSERNPTNFYQFAPTGTIASYLYQAVRYAGDVETLRRYYPVIRECAEYYRKWMLIGLPGNNIMTIPHVDRESIYPSQDGFLTVCTAARLFDIVVRSATRLGEDDQLLPVWGRYRDQMLHLARHIKSLPYEESAIYPTQSCYHDLELDTLSEPDLQVDSAMERWRDENRSLGEDHKKTAGQDVSGDRAKPRNWPWGAFQTAYHEATQGHSVAARPALEPTFRVLLPFGAQCESAEDDFSRIDHPWFNTAAGSLLRAIARMLIYPQDDDIRLFPGIPVEWTDFKMEMPAHGGVSVLAEVKGGCLIRLELHVVTAQKPRTIRLHVPCRWIKTAPPLRSGLVWAGQDDKIVTLALKGEPARMVLIKDEAL